ncbi:hypothetical protein K0M31_003074 [Melipona bicolor]|uniref:Uncharacterized protein n=1 Tax=Melipona bicolor TaxID=60889 RepID=A0AA40G067_9HYME|nr:hypothetical protein K0M31_003074 [Melipona bicolor]
MDTRGGCCETFCEIDRIRPDRERKTDKGEKSCITKRKEAGNTFHASASTFLHRSQPEYWNKRGTRYGKKKPRSPGCLRGWLNVARAGLTHPYEENEYRCRCAITGRGCLRHPPARTD